MNAYAVRLNGSPTARMSVRNPEDWIERHWVQGRYYEPAVIQAMQKIRQEIDGPAGFLDIGAHRGNHSVAALVACEFDFVYAIEPMQANFDALRLNMTANAAPGRWWIARLAVGLNAAQIRMAVPVGHENNSGMARTAMEGELVDGLSVWQVIAHAHEAPVPIGLVKCDAEGMERQLVPALLRGLNVPVISGMDLGELDGAIRTPLPLDHALYVP